MSYRYLTELLLRSNKTIFKTLEYRMMSVVKLLTTLSVGQDVFRLPLGCAALTGCNHPCFSENNFFLLVSEPTKNAPRNILSTEQLN